MSHEEDGSLRARLVGAAVAALEDGRSEISLRGLARDVGVSAMAPYRHFPDKAALLGAVAGHGFSVLRHALVEADASGEGADALVAQGLAYLGFATAHPALFRLMFSGACETPAASIGETAYAVLARRVGSLTDDPDATLACWGLVHGLATLALERHPPPDRAPSDPAGALRLLAQGLPKRAGTRHEPGARSCP